MKVIAKDNFDRESVPDHLVCENVNNYYAKLIAKLLNDQCDLYSPYFFTDVEDDYELYTFEP